jgi:DNA-binding beta-propeller fold protein YncE
VLVSGCVGAQHDVTLKASCPDPTALAAMPDGSLFVASSDGGRVYRVDGDRCTELPGAFPQAAGLAVLNDGTLCVGHAGSDDPLQRRSVVSCRTADGWAERIGSVGSGVNGLVATRDGFWMLGSAWSDTPVERRDGLLSLVRRGEVVRQIEMPGEVPLYGTEVAGGALWISIESAPGDRTVQPGLVRLGPSGSLTRLDVPTDRPAGLAYDRDRDGVWIADAGTGALILVSLDGTERERRPGLAQPTGVAVSARCGACVAEARADRVRCFGSADPEGGSP